MKKIRFSNTRLVKIAVLLGIAIGLFFYFSILFRMYYADVCFEKSVKLITKEKYESALHYIDAAIKSNPKEPNYYRLKAKALILVSTELTSEEIYVRKIDTLNALEHITIFL